MNHSKTILVFFLFLFFQDVDAQTFGLFQNKKGLYGYTNSRGKTVISPRFDYAESFVDSFAIVSRSGRVQILKLDGTFLTDSIFELVWPFQQGFFLVRKAGKYAYLDRTGKVVRNFWFDRALLFVDNYAEAWQGNTTFVMYRDGNIFPYGSNRLQRLNEPLSTMVQEMPRFPGGNRMRQDIIGQLVLARYGVLPLGMVSVQAVVEKDGSLSQISLLNSLGDGIIEQLTYALENMPPWIPAKQNGEPVRSKVSFSISYSNNEKS